MLLPLLGLDIGDWQIVPLLLLAALALDAVIGAPPALLARLPHPIRMIGGTVGWLDRRLNRDNRSAADRRIRGVVAVLSIVSGVAAVGVAVTMARVSPVGWILELFLMVALLAQRSLFDHVRRVAQALRGTGLDGGRNAVAQIVGRDVALLDEHGVARAAIESCAENFSDAVVAPTFWYVLFGLPGILVYKAVNTMDSMIGHTSPRYRAFGMAAARLDDALNLIPARLSGLFLAIAAMFVPTASPAAALRTMLRDAGKHRSVNAGWPESAAAGALGLALAGPRRYQGDVVNDAWLGDGRARATVKDIDRALYLYVIGCAINALVVAVTAVLVTGGPQLMIGH